jgi:hypothetical protein
MVGCVDVALLVRGLVGLRMRKRDVRGGEMGLRVRA